MDLSLTQDQTAILDALDRLVHPFETASLHQTGLNLVEPSLDAALQEGGFLDVGFDPDLGLVSAALVAERLARLPQASETALSSILRPLLGINDAATLVVVEEKHQRRPLPFLKAGAHVIVLGDTVTSFIAADDQVEQEPEALFGYPVAHLTSLPAERTTHDVTAEQFQTHWRIALSAEMAGLLAAALKSVCDHTSERHQFGRPLASFQGLRHRLAEAQVRINGLYWLAMRAAASQDPGDAALALLHAQKSARQIIYDFHQFLGGMGMTLEHPLHLWTYRLKLRMGEAGGHGRSASGAAMALWG